jgi:2-C-methyl-D-erythritol 4-phosphate cytidylyltransferase
VPGEAIVAIHDGLRPLVSKELVSKMFSLMQDGRRALVPVVGSEDSLKSLRVTRFEDGSERFDEEPSIRPDSSLIWTAQTPQLFIAGDIRDAYAQAYDTAFTDDASVAARKGIPLTWIRGERYNLRITAPEDFALARLVISSLSR